MFLGLYDSFASALCEYRLNQTTTLTDLAAIERPFHLPSRIFCNCRRLQTSVLVSRDARNGIAIFRVTPCGSEAEGPQTNLSYRSR